MDSIQIIALTIIGGLLFIIYRLGAPASKDQPKMTFDVFKKRGRQLLKRIVTLSFLKNTTWVHKLSMLSLITGFYLLMNLASKGGGVVTLGAGIVLLLGGVHGLLISIRDQE